MQLPKEILVRKGAESEQDEQHTHQEAKVANTVHYESLLGSICIRFVFEPEADEQVRA